MDDADAAAPLAEIILAMSGPENFEHIFINKPAAVAHAVLADAALVDLEALLERPPGAAAAGSSGDDLLDSAFDETVNYERSFNTTIKHLARVLMLAALDDVEKPTAAWRLAGTLALGHCTLGLVRRATSTAKALEAKFAATPLGRDLVHFDVPRRAW